MKKLNGVQSIGSVVNYNGGACVVSNAFSFDFQGEMVHSYDVSSLEKSIAYCDVSEEMLEIITLKSPLKKHITKLNSITKKIVRINKQINKEMNKIEKSRGWNDLPYDHYDNQYEAIVDGLSCGYGVDELEDERVELLAEMVKSARKVK